MVKNQNCKDLLFLEKGEILYCKCFSNFAYFLDIQLKYREIIDQLLRKNSKCLAKKYQIRKDLLDNKSEIL